MRLVMPWHLVRKSCKRSGSVPGTEVVVETEAVAVVLSAIAWWGIEPILVGPNTWRMKTCRTTWPLWRSSRSSRLIQVRSHRLVWSRRTSGESSSSRPGSPRTTRFTWFMTRSMFTTETFYIGSWIHNGPVGSTAVALLGISTLESVPGGAGGRPLENTWMVEIIGLPYRLYTLYVMARNQKASRAETVEKWQTLGPWKTLWAIGILFGRETEPTWLCKKEESYSCASVMYSGYTTNQLKNCTWWAMVM